MSGPYTTHVEYRFMVHGDEFAIIPFTNGTQPCLEIEETRKNGQEDCHCSGILVKDDNGIWKWEDGRRSFDFYMGANYADGIIDYINANPPPSE